MFLPSGNLYFVKNDNSLENVMITDLIDYQDFINEIDYLFNKCGYKKSDYSSARYVKNNKIVFETKIEEE